LKPSPTLNSIYRRGSDTAYLLLYVDDMSLQLPHLVYFNVLF
jgi:hypothetical protein